MRTSTRRWILGLALGVAGVVARPPSADAGEMPSKRYRDSNAKFSFRIFADWDPIPTETESKDDGSTFSFGGTDKYTVAHYSKRGTEKRDLWPAEVRAYRMGRGAAGLKTSGETTGDGTGGGMESDPFLERLKKQIGADDPKTMKDLFDKALQGYGFSGFLDPKAAKPVKSKDGVEGQMWVVEKKNERVMGPDEKPFLLVFASWKKDEMELGLWLRCGPDLKKKYEQGFVAVVKSFMFFDPLAEDVKSLDILNGLPISAKRRQGIERGLVKGWDVMVSPLKNYIIVYNTMGKRNTSLAKIIAERIEAIRAQVYERIFPPSGPIEACSIVRICGNEEEYHKYGGPWGSAGYWSDDTEELVFYDASPARAPDDDTLSVLYHEAFHQYVYYSVGEVAPHSWFNEGTGDYFAGARYAGGKFTIRPFAWRVDTIKNAIRKGSVPVEISTDADGDPVLKFDWSHDGYIPLQAFVRMTQSEYYGPLIGNCYAQGWAFNYFLREIVPKNEKYAKWGKILSTYFDTLKREVNKDKPLAPKKEKPDDGGGMDDPGMDDPGMDDPGMNDPGMDDPGMTDPGMTDPPAGGDTPPEAALPKRFSRFANSERALRIAVEEAFKGFTDADWAELEKAWKTETLKFAK